MFNPSWEPFAPWLAPAFTRLGRARVRVRVRVRVTNPNPN